MGVLVGVLWICTTSAAPSSSSAAVAAINLLCGVLLGTHAGERQSCGAARRHADVPRPYAAWVAELLAVCQAVATRIQRSKLAIPCEAEALEVHAELVAWGDGDAIVVSEVEAVDAGGRDGGGGAVGQARGEGREGACGR